MGASSTWSQTPRSRQAWTRFTPIWASDFLNQEAAMAFRKAVLAAAVAMTMAGAAHAQISDGVIKIGVLNDGSSLYADIAGQGSVVAAHMAVEDFGAAKKGMKVEVIYADHQNKPEVGSA